VLEVTCGVDGASLEETGVTDVHREVSIFNEGLSAEGSLTTTLCGGGTQVVDICGESSLAFDNGGLEKAREGEGTRVAPSSEDVVACIGSVASFGKASEDSARGCTDNSFSSRKPSKIVRIVLNTFDPIAF